MARNPNARIHHEAQKKNAEKGPPPPSGRSSDVAGAKYGNIKIYVFDDGFISTDKKLTGHGKVKEKYDSHREYYRFLELALLQRAGKISGLRKQVPLEIQPAFRCEGKLIRPIIYVADFLYANESGEWIVEDVKGLDAKTGKHIMTADFKLKWKLLKYRYRDKYCFRIY